MSDYIALSDPHEPLVPGYPSHCRQDKDNCPIHSPPLQPSFGTHRHMIILMPSLALFLLMNLKKMTTGLILNKIPILINAHNHDIIMSLNRANSCVLRKVNACKYPLYGRYMKDCVYNLPFRRILG